LLEKQRKCMKHSNNPSSYHPHSQPSAKGPYQVFTSPISYELPGSKINSKRGQESSTDPPKRLAGNL
jgi:hypothetical protein